MAAVTVLTSRDMPIAHYHRYRHCEKVSYHPRRPLALHQPMAARVFTPGPGTMRCICTAVSVQSVSVWGRGERTDLESCKGRRPPSAPYLWIAGLSTRTSAESETLPSLYLQTDGASRACELQPRRGMPTLLLTLCPISCTWSRSGHPRSSGHPGTHLPGTCNGDEHRQSCDASVQWLTSKDDLSRLHLR